MRHTDARGGIDAFASQAVRLDSVNRAAALIGGVIAKHVFEKVHIGYLAAIVAEFQPSRGRRLGVLVDHLVTGSKEARIAATVRSPDVLVRGLSQERVRRLVPGAGKPGSPLERLPGGWVSALPSEAPLRSAALWRRALARDRHRPRAGRRIRPRTATARGGRWQPRPARDPSPTTRSPR